MATELLDDVELEVELDVELELELVLELELALELEPPEAAATAGASPDPPPPHAERANTRKHIKALAAWRFWRKFTVMLCRLRTLQFATG